MNPNDWSSAPSKQQKKRGVWLYIALCAFVLPVLFSALRLIFGNYAIIPVLVVALIVIIVVVSRGRSEKSGLGL